MAATVHGASRFGITDDSTATGLLLGDLSYDYSVEITYAMNHVGNKVSMALLNDMTEVTASGVVAVKGTGMIVNLGDALTLVNATTDGLNLNSQNLISTPVANAGTVISGASLKRVNADFENGEVKAIFNPLIATNSPSTVS
jgi:hypothetical protein